jgi:hypothetical protein
MWNTIAKYDVISVWYALGFEDDYDEIKVIGEVTNLTNDKMVVRDENGAYHVIERNDLIDLDHINYADRNEVYRH